MPEQPYVTVKVGPQVPRGFGNIKRLDDGTLLVPGTELRRQAAPGTTATPTSTPAPSPSSRRISKSITVQLVRILTGTHVPEAGAQVQRQLTLQGTLDAHRLLWADPTARVSSQDSLEEKT